jgi:hypothetical protein
MSKTYIPVAIRRQVIERAENRCEYCRLHEDDSFFGFAVDHIIAEKHGGATTLENLAYSCGFCNQNKGSDIASIRAPDDLEFIRFYNPRRDVWAEHFRLTATMYIEGLTDIGRVTARIFGFNAENRVEERLLLNSK